MTRKHAALLPSFALIALMGACSLTKSPDIFDTAGIKAMPVTGGTYQAALRDEYLAWGEAKLAENDWGHARYALSRAIEAAKGEAILPMDLDEEDEPAMQEAEVAGARILLLEVINEGGADHAPYATAQALSAFDCWFEELAEQDNQTLIAACRADFYQAFARAEAAIDRASMSAGELASYRP